MQDGLTLQRSSSAMTKGKSNKQASNNSISVQKHWIILKGCLDRRRKRAVEHQAEQQPLA